MKIVVVKIRIKPDKIELYEAAFSEFAAKVRALEPYTPFFQSCRDPEVPNGYLVIEAYNDDASHALHAQSDYYLASRPVMAECLASLDMASVCETI